MAKPTIDPWANEDAAPAPEAAPPEIISMTMRVDAAIAERARNAAYWSRRAINDIMADGLERVVLEMEAANGGPFEKSPEPLKHARRKPRKAAAKPGGAK